MIIEGDYVVAIEDIDDVRTKDSEDVYFVTSGSGGRVDRIDKFGAFVRFDDFPEVAVRVPFTALTLSYPQPAVPAHQPDMVNHPPHYTSSPAKCSECGHQIECIDVVQHMGFSIGNAVKYLWRAGLKNDAIEDLKKAVWYINAEIAKREKSE